MRTITYKDGEIYEIIDTRTLDGAKAASIAFYKEIYGTKMLEAYPIYKQQNAALGLYDGDEINRIRNGIQALRDECNAKEAAILACETLAELDAL